MSNLKIVIVGGGSYAWTPKLVCNILLNEFLDGCEIMLHDLNAEALELTHAACLKYRDAAGSSTRIEQTTDQAAALDGAHAVVVTITTGGFRAMAQDLAIPEKYGVFHTVGDTVGPGGLVRALRNVPVFLQLGRAMEEHYCPTAWMLNCSNPLCALTRVVNRETSIRALGVCHGVPHIVKAFADFFGAELDQCAYVNTGIDHCSWFTHFRVDGRCAWELLREKGVDDWLALPADQAEQDETFKGIYSLRVGILLGRNLGGLPAISDRHMVEFVPGFLDSEETVKEYGLRRTTIEEREKGAAEGRAKLERILSGEEEVKASRGSDPIDTSIAALYGGPPREDNLNAPNVGQVPQLPEGAIVETRGVLDSAGVHPLVSPLPAPLEAVVRPHTIRETLTVDAALEGDFEKALAALSSDPLIKNADVARPLLKEMIAATKEWLPQF